jgi:hypothetical protein
VAALPRAPAQGRGQWQRVRERRLAVGSADGLSWADWPGPGPKRNKISIFISFQNEAKLVLI